MTARKDGQPKANRSSDSYRINGLKQQAKTRDKWTRELVGREVNLLTVVGIDVERLRNGYTNWIALCDCKCGKKTRKYVSQIADGSAKSCGCLLRRKGALCPKWKGTPDISANFFSHRKQSAIARGIAWTLTIEELQKQWDHQKGLCHYTGWPIRWATPEEKHLASIDRIVPALGYVPGNIVFTSWLINRLKNNLTGDAMIALCRAVAMKHPSDSPSAPGDIGETRRHRATRRDSLTPESVLDIRAMLKEDVPVVRIAAKHGVSPATIRYIDRGETWKQVV